MLSHVMESAKPSELTSTPSRLIRRYLIGPRKSKSFSPSTTQLIQGTTNPFSERGRKLIEQMLSRAAARTTTSLVSQRGFHATRARLSSPYHYPEGALTNLPFNPRKKGFGIMYWGFMATGFLAPFGIAGAHFCPERGNATNRIYSLPDLQDPVNSGLEYGGGEKSGMDYCVHCSIDIAQLPKSTSFLSSADVCHALLIRAGIVYAIFTGLPNFWIHSPWPCLYSVRRITKSAICHLPRPDPYFVQCSRASYA